MEHTVILPAGTILIARDGTLPHREFTTLLRDVEVSCKSGTVYYHTSDHKDVTRWYVKPA